MARATLWCVLCGVADAECCESGDPVTQISLKIHQTVMQLKDTQPV